jgi:hypothetical protein
MVGTMAVHWALKKVEQTVDMWVVKTVVTTVDYLVELLVC